jgi:hypothetical protein
MITTTATETATRHAQASNMRDYLWPWLQWDESSDRTRAFWDVPSVYLPGAKENALNRVGLDDVSKESDDDSQYTAGTAEAKEERFKQLSPVSGLQTYHGKSSINAEDGTSLASQGNRIDVDDDQDEEEESLRLPSSYSVSIEKKDDTSSGGQPTIEPKASF